MLASLLKQQVLGALVDEDTRRPFAPVARTVALPVRDEDFFLQQVVVVDEDPAPIAQAPLAARLRLVVVPDEEISILLEDASTTSPRVPQLRLLTVPTWDTDEVRSFVLDEADDGRALRVPLLRLVTTTISDAEEARTPSLTEADDDGRTLRVPLPRLALVVVSDAEEARTPSLTEADDDGRPQRVGAATAAIAPARTPDDDEFVAPTPPPTPGTIVPPGGGGDWPPPDDLFEWEGTLLTREEIAERCRVRARVSTSPVSVKLSTSSVTARVSTSYSAAKITTSGVKVRDDDDSDES